MVINLAFFIIIAISVIRTVSFGIYVFKNDGKLGGISVFILAAASLGTAFVILFTQIVQ